jgi:succinate-acetate transporter protein
MPAFLAFALLTVAYLLLGIANISNPGNFANFMTKAGGWVLIADGLSAWYLSWGLAVNSVVGERIPLYPYPYSTAAAKEAPADITPMPAA